ncbi:TusE/DsrC/DsvC family sulfur relay protein [Candidatus Latescibacterota bacterium]
MPTQEINGTTIELDADGHMTDPAAWNEDIAREFAKELDIELTDDHFKVINFLRKVYLETGTHPTLRKIGKQSGVTMKDLYSLFPDGPVKKSSKIAGLSKPKSCV